MEPRFKVGDILICPLLHDPNDKIVISGVRPDGRYDCHYINDTFIYKKATLTEWVLDSRKKQKRFL